MHKPVSTTLQRSLLALLCLSALAGIAHSAFWRSMPTAFEPRLDRLEIEGYQAQAMQTQPAQSSASYAYSTLHEWQLHPAQEPEQAVMRITLVGVHSRSDKGLGIKDTASLPALPEVTERRTIVAEQGNIIGTAVSIGRSGDDAVLQTCLPAGGHAHVMLEELAQSIMEQRPGGWMSRAERLLGLQPNIRWECLLVSISMPRESASDEALLAAWNSVYPVLKTRQASPR